MQALLFSPLADEIAVLTAILQQAGLSVRSVRNYPRAVENWPEKPADLIMVSLHENSVTRGQLGLLSAHSDVPLIVITDPISEDAQVDLMEAGVDLVVSRPFGVRLLLAQIKGQLRRSSGVPYFSLPTLHQAGMTLDPASRTVQVKGDKPKRLTQLEFRLLYTFITHPGQIIPAENLVELVWGYSGDGNRELVRGLVQRLRAKIEPEPRKPIFVMTEPGVGYFFNQQSEVSEK